MPADMIIASSSTEYVNVPVSATMAGTPYNPTGDLVYMAFVAGSAQPSTFYEGNWVTTVQGTYIARCLVGPANSGTVLAPGLYVVWVKITDSPEVPIRQAGTLQIS
jgi:hypothetical protein